MPHYKCMFVKEDGTLCGNERIHANNTDPQGKKIPVCQYHYRVLQETKLLSTLKRFLDHIDELTVKDARFANLLDWKLFEELKKFVNKKTTKKGTPLPKGREADILKQLGGREEAITALEVILKQLKSSKN